MTEAPPRVRQQPKLRSSCDECGAAKLRCDRGQPECKRCLSLGIICIYGVSRKTGKPSRRFQSTEATTTSRTKGNLVSGLDRNANNARSSVETCSTSFMTSIDALNAPQTDRLGSVFPDYTSLEFDAGLGPSLEAGSMFTLGSLDMEGYSTPAGQTEASLTQIDGIEYVDSAFLSHAGGRDHDCFREAYETLGILSAHSLNNAHSAAQLSTIGGTANQAPLDHVLRINREASEQLSRLMTCSCARSPHLTLLFTSVISQILLLYQQAASWAQNAAWSPTAMTLDTNSLHQPSPGSGSGSGSAGLSTCSSGASSTFGTGSVDRTPILGQSHGRSVAPARMTIGTFYVDDLRVQAALKIQLLLGEMRRVGSVVEQFASHNSISQNLNHESNFDAVHSLYQSLDSWLKEEHARILNLLRSTLRELNT